ncbi:hypothetical protein BD779DRAFT_1468715 [Infundibulicybe gibba]|nr:hypothetical protein BD779DRAFT_1468715 [Infundibulicybe gibba]
MQTVTFTRVQAETSRRPRALSLIAARSSPLFNIPAELVLDILESAIIESGPTLLASVSKSIRAFIELIIYRNVVLHTPYSTLLFCRTIAEKPAAFAANHVKRLAITWNPDQCHASPHLGNALRLCTGLRSLSVPSCLRPVDISFFKHTASHDGPSEITIQCYDINESQAIAPFVNISRTISHLRICEPSDGWYSPATILASFGLLPDLTHLQLPRRTNANEDNDAIFVEDVESILQTRPLLKMLVISIFVQEPASIADSNIWTLLLPLRMRDPRLTLLVGKYDEWTEGLGEFPAFRRSITYDFWSMAKHRESDVLVEEGNSTTSMDES